MTACATPRCERIACFFGDGKLCLNCFRQRTVEQAKSNLAQVFRDAVLVDVGGLNDDERAVVAEAAQGVADALRKGRTTYGPLDLATDQRDLDAELAAEARDLTVYDAMRRVRARRAG